MSVVASEIGHAEKLGCVYACWRACAAGAWFVTDWMHDLSFGVPSNHPNVHRNADNTRNDPLHATST